MHYSLRVIKRLGPVAVLLYGITLSAQLVGNPATFEPAVPTSSNVIRSEFDVSSACFFPGMQTTTEVIGTTVRTTVVSPGCTGFPEPSPIPIFASFGPLRAGTYTYQIYLVFQGFAPELRSSQPLVVVDTPVPTMSAASYAFLGLFLAAVALMMLRQPSA